MPRQWRCANGHLWTGEIGALTFCPECNSRDVFEVRTAGAPAAAAAPESDATFSQPRRRRHSDRPSKPRRSEVPEEPTAEQTQILPATELIGGKTLIQPLPPLDVVAPPALAAETTVTQIPKPSSPSELSTQEFLVPAAAQSTVTLPAVPTPEAPLAAEAQSTVTLPPMPSKEETSGAAPAPDGLPSNETLVCHGQGESGSASATICRPSSDQPTLMPASGLKSTVDWPTPTNDPDRTLPDSGTIADRHGDLGSTGSWNEPVEAEATAASILPPSRPASEVVPAESAVSLGRRQSGETAETKVKPGPRAPMSAKPADGKQPHVEGYEILGVLGRGGMGVVYKAKQKGLNRLVALKMIIGGAHIGAGERGRFETEALAVAKLQHINIVQVYEVGESDGLPFFSLEFVEGGSLQQWTDGKPQPPRIAAAIVEQLARAMQYAHANGIVHRDLKPANILLKNHDESDSTLESRSEHTTLSGPRPVKLAFTPKITDFGLAKDLQSESGLTGTGAIMGTPSFMSPEQAEGKTKEIGPPTDIHALGAILYDLLTGRPPFLGADAMATIMQVRMMEPVPPRRWQPSLPRDLETVCLKCLEKSPARRFATAGDLADDLRRFLDGSPVKARPTSWLEKCWKWAKRRPTAALLVVVSSLAIVGGAVAAARFAQWQHQRAETEHRLREEAENERNRAQQQERLAKQESARAQANFDAARLAMDAFLTRVGDEKLRREPRTERLQSQLLESALTFYDRFLKTPDGAAPAVRREAGWAYQRAGRVREMLGQRAAAIAAYREAVRLFRSLAREDPTEPLNRKGLADSHRQLAIALEADNQPAAADEAFANAKKLLDELIAASPHDPIYRLELSALMNNRGSQLANRGKYTEAIEAYEIALDALKIAAASKDLRFETGKTNANLGTLFLMTNQVDRGREKLQAAAEHFRQLAEGEEDPLYAREWGRAMANLGTAWMLSQQPEEAIRIYREAAAVFGQLAEKFPRVPAFRFELAKAHDNVAEVLQTTKGRRDAEPEREKARTLLRDLAAAHPEIDEHRVRYALSLDLRAAYLAEIGRREEAIAAVQESVAMLKKSAADDPYDPDVQRHLGQRFVNLGQLLVQDGQEKEAESAYQQAISILESAVQRWPALDAARKSLIDAHWNRALLMKHLGRPVEEETDWMRAAVHQTKRAEDFPDRPDLSAELARMHFTLAGLRIETPAPAIAALREAYDRQKQAFQLAPQRADLLANLGVYGTALVEALTNTGDYAGAAQAAKRLTAELPAQWRGFPKIAGLLSQCIRAAREDAKRPESDRDQLARQCGAAAMAALRRAVSGGFRDAASLQSMPELAALRESPEFQEEFAKLIAAMTKSG